MTPYRSVHETQGDGPAANDAAGAEVPPKKYDYIFGRVSSNEHNAARSLQIGRDLARIGIHDNASGRAILEEHFRRVVADTGSVSKTYTDEHGLFELRESILAGPGGFLKLETAWKVVGAARIFCTVITKGKGG